MPSVPLPPSRGRADASTSNESPAQVEERKSQAMRTALWGLGVAILSNLANVLKQLKDVLESVVQLEQFILEHLWISTVAIGAAIVLGNVLLFHFLYKRLKQRIRTAYKVMASAGSLAVVTVVLLTNFFSLRSLVQSPLQVQTTLLSELAATQDIDGGGFRNATTAEGLQDTWTTAQSVKALLVSGTYDVGRIKKAFSFIELKRKDEGFEVIVGRGTPPFIRTEVGSWVAIAYLQALSRPDVWTGSERAEAISRVETTLLLLASQQDRSSGGWSPIPGYVATRQRTYATLMAVWALTEALLSRGISAETSERLGAPFEAGISWIISHYEPNLGWEEDPKFQLRKPFPGLTYQILFVLEKAQMVAGHNTFKDTEAYKRVKRELRNTLHPAHVGDLTSVPNTYMMVGEYPCWADVLSYPWLISILPKLVTDPDVPAENRSFLKALLKNEVNQVSEVPHILEHAETWQVAEDLFGVSSLINSNKATH